MRLTNRRSVHIRIPDDLDEWLAAEADRRAVSKTFLVERALEQLRAREEVEA